MTTTPERIFPSLPASAIASLHMFLQPRQVAKGVALLRQGELWDKAFIIERGLLRMAFTRRDGREFNKSFHFEGMLVCPITDAMVHQPSLFSIHTVEPCLLLQAAACSRCWHWPPTTGTGARWRSGSWWPPWPSMCRASSRSPARSTCR